MSIKLEEISGKIFRPDATSIAPMRITNNEAIDLLVNWFKEQEIRERFIQSVFAFKTKSILVPILLCHGSFQYEYTIETTMTYTGLGAAFRVPRTNPFAPGQYHTDLVFAPSKTRTVTIGNEHRTDTISCNAIIPAVLDSFARKFLFFGERFDTSGSLEDQDVISWPSFESKRRPSHYKRLVRRLLRRAAKLRLDGIIGSEACAVRKKHEIPNAWKYHATYSSGAHLDSLRNLDIKVVGVIHVPALCFIYKDFLGQTYYWFVNLNSGIIVGDTPRTLLGYLRKIWKYLFSSTIYE